MLSTEEQNILHMRYFQIFTHISVNILFKNHSMLVAKYIYE